MILGFAVCGWLSVFKTDMLVTWGRKNAKTKFAWSPFSSMPMKPQYPTYIRWAGIFLGFGQSPSFTQWLSSISVSLEIKLTHYLICRCATPLLGRVTLGVSRHLGAREYQSCWPADSAQATQGNSKPESRNAFWSNVKVQEQPALVPSAAITASANEPGPSLSAIMALKTSCSFSTTSTSV
jgi:hypothetical protein